MIKTAEQILGIRKSCKLSADCLVYIEPYIVPGVKSIELNNLIEKFIVDNGAIPASLNYKNFPAATCISINEVVCHGIPDDTVLKEGDIVSVDVATILNGYYGDTCYTFPVGKISKKSEKLIKVAKDSLQVGIYQVKSGSPVGNIGYNINKYIQNFGYSVCTTFTGHGVGLKFHEDLVIYHSSPKDSGCILQDGMIFTIEPIINAGTPEVLFDGWIAKTKDNRLAAQFEHTVLVNGNSCEILTDSELWK